MISSRSFIFDEDIPFYQLVMHGIIPYSGTALNAESDMIDTFLKAVATGCQPSYDMIYTSSSNLKDTELEKYYYANYEFWTDTAVQEYQIMKRILSKVSDKIGVIKKIDEINQTIIFLDNSELPINEIIQIA